MSPSSFLSKVVKTSLIFLPWLGFQLPIHQTSNPTTCFDSTTLNQVIDCLDTYTVPAGIYNRASYDAAQPTETERDAWRNTIFSLLSVDGDCHTVELPPALVDIYTIAQITESSGASYCVLSEMNGERGHYVKGWGLFVTPATRAAARRNIHIAAPHPGFEFGTPQQAATLFQTTGAKSLLIPGRARTSFKASSGCVQSTQGAVYYITDPTHNNLEPFFDASLSIYDWQMDNGGCPASSCAFIQLHGKADTTCHLDNMFVSTGLGNSISSKIWYTDATPRPAKTLKVQLEHAFPNWNISLPSDSTCLLTATKNVVGRFLNGVDERDVCMKGSKASMALGFFVHVEQAAAAWSPSAYKGWTQALVNTFEEVN